MRIGNAPQQIEITDYPHKETIIRRYRDSQTEKKAIVEGGVNTPFRITLNCDGEAFSFTLLTSELVHLLGEFAVSNIDELFRN
jgi:hypothetical protein